MNKTLKLFVLFGMITTVYSQEKIPVKLEESIITGEHKEKLGEKQLNKLQKELTMEEKLK